MRFFATAMTGLLLFSGAALAEPPKAGPRQPAQTDSQPRPAKLILASAEPVRGTSESAPVPVKRHVAPRVTTCRCGDPQTSADPDSE